MEILLLLLLLTCSLLCVVFNKQPSLQLFKGANENGTTLCSIHSAQYT